MVLWDSLHGGLWSLELTALLTLKQFRSCTSAGGGGVGQLRADLAPNQENFPKSRREYHSQKVWSGAPVLKLRQIHVLSQTYQNTSTKTWCAVQNYCLAQRMESELMQEYILKGRIPYGLPQGLCCSRGSSFDWFCVKEIPVGPPRSCSGCYQGHSPHLRPLCSYTSHAHTLTTFPYLLDTRFPIAEPQMSRSLK